MITRSAFSKILPSLIKLLRRTNVAINWFQNNNMIVKFDFQIGDLRKSASGKHNAVFRLKSFIGLEERKILIQSFICVNSILLLWSGISQLLTVNRGV